MDTARTTCLTRLTALTAGALLAASAVVAATGAPARAVPPDNDLIAHARTITGSPTRIVQGTRGATSSADDGECVGGDSIWYRFSPTTTRTTRVVTVGSKFDTMLAISRGPRTDRTPVACSDDGVGAQSALEVRFVAGRTYWIAVSACCSASGVGGHSVLRLYQPRPAGTSATVDSVQTGAVSGRIYASGTVRCNTPSYASVYVSVSQRVGTMVARGSGGAEIAACLGTSRSWSMQIDSDTAVAFQEGTASVTVESYAGDGFEYVSFTETTNETVGSNPNRLATR